MIRTTTLMLALAAVVWTSGVDRASAQASTSPCPPGQPCVVVVPQPQPEPAPVIVQPQPAQVQGYVTVQPVAPQQPIVYGAPAPQRQAVEVTRTRLRWGLVVPGIVATLVGWVGNWLTATVGIFFVDSVYDVSSYYGWSWIPWIGPWVNAGYHAGSDRDGFLGMHVAWGIVQGAGLLMCILGTVLQEEVVEVQYVLGDGVEMAVLPWADQNGGGLQVGMSF